MLLEDLVSEIGQQQFMKNLAAELRSLAESNPDFQYITEDQNSRPGNAKCSYDSGPKDYTNAPFPDNTEEQNKGCIFGRALRNMGIELGDNINHIYDILSDYIRRDFANVCWTIQSDQDLAGKWGKLLPEISKLERLCGAK